MDWVQMSVRVDLWQKDNNKSKRKGLRMSARTKRQEVELKILRTR